VWITYWHPLKAKDGAILGINVAAEEEITEQKARQSGFCNLRTKSLEARYASNLPISLEELRAAQDRLVPGPRKLASLGQLTAGYRARDQEPTPLRQQFFSDLFHRVDR